MTSAWGQRRLNRFNSPKQRRSFDGSAFLIGAAIVLVIIGVVIWTVLYFGSRTTIQGCTVDSKDRGVTVTSDGEGNTTSKTDYRVYTDCGVFQVEDNFFLGKFNSADTYGSLKEDHTYDLEVIGFRNGFFSWFPNILSAVEISTEPAQ